MRPLRLIPALELDPRLVAFVQKPLGKFALLSLFLASLSLVVDGRLLIDTAVVLILLSIFESQRRVVLSFAALYWAVVHVEFRWDLLAYLRQRLPPTAELPDFGVFRVQIVAAVFIAGALLHHLFRQRRDSWAARQPAWFLASAQLGLLATLAAIPPWGTSWIFAWAFVLGLGSYLWFFAYALLDLRKNRNRSFADQVGFLHPFWGSTNTPFPKGIAYAEQIEARDATQLAVARLKGLKLLWWSLALIVVQEALRAALFGEAFFGRLLPVSLAVPPIEIAFRASSVGRAFPWQVNFASMMADLALDGLRLSIWGHQFVAVARQAGFAARRNTYKPFLATNVSDFFNRYYYYFKELLVDCFFYPVFYSLPRKRFKLALFLATMSAAGLGNYLYHFLRDAHITAERGIAAALRDSHMLLLYCTLLAMIIFLSQVRRIGRNKQGPGSWRSLRGMVAVWIIFALLNTLVVELWNSNLSDHVRFLADSLPLSAIR